VIAPIVFLLAALMAVATGILGGEFSYAKTSQHLGIARAAQEATSLAQAQLLAALAGTVQSNLQSGLPAATGIDASFTRQTPLTQEPGSTLWYSTYEQINGTTNETAAQATDTAANLQASTLGQEQRLSSVVSIEIHGAAPASPLLAKRSRLLTLRIFSVPPFAIVDGSRDLATADDETGAAEGDPAGTLAAPDDATTPDPARPDDYHDTTIKVRHECAGPDTGGVDPGTFGYDWGTGDTPAVDSLCDPTPPPWATSPAPPPPPGIGDTFATQSWGNSNLNQTGWTR
jgi:hypothetical protein